MVATKFYSGHDDEAPYVNWAECTSSDNLLQMELSFLNAIDWKVYVSRDQFLEKVKSLEMTLARQQGIARGFFTYLEMDCVMPSVDSATQFIQAAVILGFSYTVFVATMVASVFLVSQIPGTCLHKNTQSALIQTNVEIPSKNSTTQPLSNNNKAALPTELMEAEDKFFDCDLTAILNANTNELEHQMQKPNATTWIPTMFCSWYSLLPVISDMMVDKVYLANLGVNLTFPSYSPFKISTFDGIKLHWV